MKRTLLTAALLVMLAGCAATGGGGATTQYDFGPLPDAPLQADGARLPALIVPDLTGPAWLDTQAMIYRLNYSDPMQARPYARSRWSATPLQLITQRIKARIAQTGARVLNVTDAPAGGLLLRIEVDDFSHSFDSTMQNAGTLGLRASLFDGHRLLGQKTFVRKTASASADAAGGVRALVASTDAATADMLGWIAALSPPRQ